MSAYGDTTTPGGDMISLLKPPTLPIPPPDLDESKEEGMSAINKIESSKPSPTPGPPGLVYNIFFGLVKVAPDALFWLLRMFAPFFTFTKGKYTKITVVTRAKDVQDVMDQFVDINVPYRNAMEPSVGAFMLARDTCPLRFIEKDIMTSVLKDEVFYDGKIPNPLSQTKIPNPLSQTKIPKLDTRSRRMNLRKKEKTEENPEKPEKTEETDFVGRKGNAMADMRSRVDSTPETIRKMTSVIAKKCIEEGLQENTGEIDVAVHLGRKVAAKILQQLFGFDAPEEKLLEWSVATHRSFFNNSNAYEEFDQKGVEAGIEMRAYIRNYILPRANKQNIISVLLEAVKQEKIQSPEYEFDEERFVSNVAGFVTGSIETTNNAICKSLHQLLNKPEALGMAVKAVQDDDDNEIAKICWEAYRFGMPPFLKRFVSNECTINGHTFKKGTVVLASTRSASMDPALNKEPETFDPDRDFTYESFHFGHGIHKCLGRYVAVPVVATVIKELILKGELGVSRIEGSRGELMYDPSDSYVESFRIKLRPKETSDNFMESLVSMILPPFVLILGFILSALKKADKVRLVAKTAEEPLTLPMKLSICFILGVLLSFSSMLLSGLLEVVKLSVSSVVLYGLITYYVLFLRDK